jgi:hypothetical protein
LIGQPKRGMLDIARSTFLQPTCLGDNNKKKCRAESAQVSIHRTGF